jgi:hypothetical protein
MPGGTLKGAYILPKCLLCEFAFLHSLDVHLLRIENDLVLTFVSLSFCLVCMEEIGAKNVKRRRTQMSIVDKLNRK